MAPAKFADLSKSAKDLLSKDYAFGEVKVEINSKTSHGVELKSTGTVPNKGGQLSGTFESKYFHAPMNAMFTEKWNTKNVLTQVVELKNLSDGVTAEMEASYAPNTGDITGKVTVDYSKPHLRVIAVGDLFNGPVATVSGVFAADNGLLFGAEGGYNVQSGALTTNTFAFGYAQKDFTTVITTDGTAFNTHIHHNASAKVDAAINIGFSRGKNDTAFAFGTTYKLEDGAYLKAKLNQAGEVGLGYTQSLRPGVKLTVGVNVDTKNITADAHKIGLALTLNA
eukprot:comp8853_c0_seq1/m.4056 comp8853_c0_seq1/g.4056  ORF comp8853_c0_seq1/g.4056 comp8853_c0_seq1/m.4056 type:complete len:281 (-) comp8853_c0_seq1:244-1086(-)